MARTSYLSDKGQSQATARRTELGISGTPQQPGKKVVGKGAGQNFSPGNGGGPFCRPRARGAPQSFLAPSWARGQLGCEQCLLDPVLTLHDPPDPTWPRHPLRSPHSWAAAALWHTYLACCGLDGGPAVLPPPTATLIRAGTKSQGPWKPSLRTKMNTEQSTEDTEVQPRRTSILVPAGAPKRPPPGHLLLFHLGEASERSNDVNTERLRMSGGNITSAFHSDVDILRPGKEEVSHNPTTGRESESRGHLAPALSPFLNRQLQDQWPLLMHVLARRPSQPLQLGPGACGVGVQGACVFTWPGPRDSLRNVLGLRQKQPAPMS